MTDAAWAGLAVLFLVFAMPWTANLELHRTRTHGDPVDGSTSGCLGALARYLLMVAAMFCAVMAVATGLGWA